MGCQVMARHPQPSPFNRLFYHEREERQTFLEYSTPTPLFKAILEKFLDVFIYQKSHELITADNHRVYA